MRSAPRPRAITERKPAGRDRMKGSIPTAVRTSGTLAASPSPRTCRHSSQLHRRVWTRSRKPRLTSIVKGARMASPRAYCPAAFGPRARANLDGRHERSLGSPTFTGMNAGCFTQSYNVSAPPQAWVRSHAPRPSRTQPGGRPSPPEPDVPTCPATPAGNPWNWHGVHFWWNQTLDQTQGTSREDPLRTNRHLPPHQYPVATVRASARPSQRPMHPHRRGRGPAKVSTPMSN